MRSNGLLYIVAVGTDGAFYNAWENSPGSWDAGPWGIGWHAVGGSGITRVATSRFPNYNITIIGRGSAGRLIAGFQLYPSGPANPVQISLSGGAPVPIAPLKIDRSTAYQYTARDELRLITDANGVQTTTNYDWMGRRTSLVDPDAGTTSYTGYNAAGSVLSFTNGRGVSTSYTYDGLGRMTTQTSGGTAIAEWQYDQDLAGVTPQDRRGLLTRSCVPTCGTGAQLKEEVVSYDTRNRVTAKQTVVANTGDYLDLGGTYRYNYGYNAADQQLTVQYPSLDGTSAARETVTTTYHATTGLTNGLTGAATYVNNSDYNARGALYQRWSVNGATNYVRQLEYDALNRIDYATVWNTGSLHQRDQFKYDASNQITSIKRDSEGSQTECFRYDDLQRLVRAWTTDNTTCATVNTAYGPSGYHEAWTYAANGNILRHGIVGGGREDFAYGGSKPHAVTSISGGAGGSYSYDNAGNVTARTRSGVTTNFAYDSADRVCATQTGGATPDCGTAAATKTRYRYGTGTNRTLRIDANGDRTLYLDSVEVKKLNGSSAKEYSRYYVIGATVVAVRKSTSPAAGGTGEVTWLFGNTQGSASVAFVGPNATVSQRNYYLPYGGRRGSDNIAVTERGWIGQLEDPTGLNYLNARYYDTTVGRFLAVDPMMSAERPPSLNGYSYSWNNPTSMVDTSGFEPACNSATTDCNASYGKWGSSPQNVARREVAIDLYVGGNSANYSQAQLIALHSLCSNACGADTEPAWYIEPLVDRYGNCNSELCGLLLLYDAVTIAAILEGGTRQNQREPSTTPARQPIGPNQVGKLREELVKNKYGNLVDDAASGKTLRTSLGRTDADVVLKNGNIIEVGGPAKGYSSRSLDQFRTKLNKLVRYGQENNVNISFEYQHGTPQQVIDIAKKILGESNVRPI